MQLGHDHERSTREAAGTDANRYYASVLSEHAYLRRGIAPVAHIAPVARPPVRDRDTRHPLTDRFFLDSCIAIRLKFISFALFVYYSLFILIFHAMCRASFFHQMHPNQAPFCPIYVPQSRQCTNPL
jgi:hypothetical protein